MPGFVYVGQISGAQDPVTVDIPIGNSVTITVGDAIQNVAGAAQLAVATATVGVFGIVVGIVDKNGIDLDNTNPSNYDGTWTPSTQTYVSANDNVTDKMVAVKVCPDPYALWWNDADGDFAAADLFRLGLLLNHAQLDESTFDDEQIGHFQVWRIDPYDEDDESECFCRISVWSGHGYEEEA